MSEIKYKTIVLPDGTDVLVEDYGQDDENPEYLDKYGLARYHYLEETMNPAEFERNGTIDIFYSCINVQNEAAELKERLLKEMKEAEGLTEEYKTKDWLGYIRKQNAILMQIEEIINHDLIYA